MRRSARFAKISAHSALSAHKVHIRFSGAGVLCAALAPYRADPHAPVVHVARGRRGWTYGTIRGARHASHAALALCGGYDPACLGNPSEQIGMRSHADEVK